MNKICLCLIITLSWICLPLNAQQDSIDLKLKAGKIITNRFPATRFLNVEYEYLTPVDYKTKLYDQPWTKGKLENQNRVRVNLNVPLYKRQKWVFTGSVRYRYSYSELNDQENESAKYPTLYNDKPNGNHTFNIGLNSTYIARVFDKPLIYNLGIIGDVSQDGFERIYASAIVSMLLKKTDRFSLTVGGLVMIDRMARYPVLPVLGLEYKITDSWLVSVGAPQYAYIRKQFSNNRRLSFGTSLDSQRFYLYPKQFDKSFLYTKTEIKTGLVYENYLEKHFILSVRAGMINALKGRLTPKNRSSNMEIMTSTQDAGAYFNIGISYNLF